MVDPARPSLEQRIRQMIAATGPMSLADYMSLCLTDPQDGYYTAHRPIGAKGDFITAPEISQLFGELIGIWMCAVWQMSGRPMPFHLVELGPGRGTLMNDMLRAICQDPEAAAALHIHLVDISPTLRVEQEVTLSGFQQTKSWHETLDTLPAAPLFIIGNEFFDCLPIHQWVFSEGRWHERVIGLDERGALTFGIGPVRALSAPSPDRGPGTANTPAPEPGAILERSPASEAIMAFIAGHLGTHGGAALFFDYGHAEPGYGDTFQAMSHHAHANPLRAPGRQDLTAHVNFDTLRRSALTELAGRPTSGLTVPAIMPQGDFLIAMGLLQRAGQLGAGQSPEMQEQLQDAVERLAGPDHMGKLFKCLALMPTGLPLPPLATD
nr:class I SAM-dependent methyltransferase [uncultured Cohaesibacter sp.]